jgi:hypothetical protein
MTKALTISTSSGIILEDILDFCEFHSIKYVISYDRPVGLTEYGTFNIKFDSTTDLEIVRAEFPILGR